MNTPPNVQADSVNALVWASVFGCIVVAALAMSQRLMTLAQVMEHWIGGMASVLECQIILLLAWGLGTVIQVHVPAVAVNANGFSSISLLNLGTGTRGGVRVGVREQRAAANAC
jgi:hypothetical protein